MMKQPETISFEFIALMATLMSISALATDSVLPALGVIGDDFAVTDISRKQLLITMTFLGLGMGQLFVGALSDSVGRKPTMYLGFMVFILASILSVTTHSFEVLVLSRILQGVGLSAPRTLSTAIIRDSFSGDHMAKVMSFVAMIFILTPVLAPSLGAFLLNYSGWHSIFYSQAILALLSVIWFALRQPETLPTEKRAIFNMDLFISSGKTFFNQKSPFIYTLALGFSAGSFMSYLSTSESIFIGQYHKVEQFPYLFASIALFIGASMFLNGKYVVKYGMKKLVALASIFFTLVPLLYIILFFQSGNPDIYVLMAFLMMQTFQIGFIFGNLTSLAMEPLGHIAGMASAITGFISTVIGVIFAAIVGSYIKTSVLPLFIGFFISGLILLILLWFAKMVEDEKSQSITY